MKITTTLLLIGLSSLTACGDAGLDPSAELGDADSRLDGLVPIATLPGKVTSVGFESTIYPTATTFFRIYLPTGYDPNRAEAYPWMMFFVGHGERGTSESALDVHGPLKTIKNNGGVAPTGFGMEDMIFVVPNHPNMGKNSTDLPLTREVYDIVVRDYNVDTARFSVTGLSMGGGGALLFAKNYPELVAASIPLSTSFNNAKTYGCSVFSAAGTPAGHNIGLWFMIGNDDKQSAYDITPYHANVLYQTMLNCNPRPDPMSRYSLVQGRAHTGTFWNEVYANQGQNWVMLGTGQDRLDSGGVRSIYDWAKKFRKGGEAEPEPPQPEIVNVAAGKPATTSGTYQTFTPDNAVDGGVANADRWVSPNWNGGHWIEIDLQGAHVVSSLRLINGHTLANGILGFPIANFAFHAWNGSAWVAIPGATMTNNSGFDLSMEITPLTTTKIRMTSSDNGHVRVREIEVYGYAL